MPRERILSSADVAKDGVATDDVSDGALATRLAGVASSVGNSAADATPVVNDDPALRPKHMQDMVGQRDVYERIKIAVDAAQKRGEPLGHILLDGPPGLGKTTFATCIPRDLGVPLQIASGAALAAPKDLLPYLTNAEEGSVLFIDEIHRLPKAVEEFMYPAMEDFPHRHHAGRRGQRPHGQHARCGRSR